jgi:hypothetical protein
MGDYHTSFIVNDLIVIIIIAASITIALIVLILMMIGGFKSTVVYSDHNCLFNGSNMLHDCLFSVFPVYYRLAVL